MKEMYVRKCADCGSHDFIVNEYSIWKAFTDEDTNAPSTLLAYTIRENGVESITCQQCEKVYDRDDFIEVRYS